MNFAAVKKPVVLGILFFLPVLFLLMLYPSTHNYNPLDIVNEKVKDITSLLSEENKEINFQDNITVLTFLGNDPMGKAISVLNLKELVYDKFKGFKRFQIIALASKGSETSLKELKKELYQYDELKYWHFVFGEETDLRTVYNSLLTKSELNSDLSSDEVFIIDKERYQRGRLDDRSDFEIQKEVKIHGLYSYNCIEIAELKNKMSEDMRILFTEYRQKRKGNFDSASRRKEELKGDEKK